MVANSSPQLSITQVHQVVRGASAACNDDVSRRNRLGRHMNLDINYIAPDNDHTGYGCAAAQYLRLLIERGARVHFQPLRPGPGLDLGYECVFPVPSLPGFAQHLFPQAVTILHFVPEYYPPLIAWLRARGCTGPVVGMTVWETTRLPRHWPKLLSELDGLIVPSAWNRDVFAASGVTCPIYCLPHASEFGGRGPSAEAMTRLCSRLPALAGKFVFYSIGDGSYRKGHDLLVKAFNLAFAGRSDVVLVLKTSPLRRWPELLAKFGFARPFPRTGDGRSAKLVVLKEDLPSDEIAALHAISGCYVTSARGEGWGLGLYEAVWFGNPFLAPDQGGHRAYLPSDQLSGLVRSVAVPVRIPEGNASYTPDQSWYEIDVPSLAGEMRRVASAPQNPRDEARSLAIQMRERFNGMAIGKHLERIAWHVGRKKAIGCDDCSFNEQSF